MSSEGCTLNSGRSSQRRAPFTSRPNPGISTSTRSATPPRNNAGAACCQSRAGTRNTVMAASRATPRNMPWRARNQAALFPVYPLASAVAMEEEYTITRPVAASRRAAQASERSYSALGALRAKTYVRLTPAASSPWRRIPRRDDGSRGTCPNSRRLVTGARRRPVPHCAVPSRPLPRESRSPRAARRCL